MSYSISITFIARLIENAFMLILLFIHAISANKNLMESFTYHNLTLAVDGRGIYEC